MAKTNSAIYENVEITPLKDVPFKHHFVFEKAMMQKDLCKLFLEEVLHKQIKDIAFIDREKDISDGFIQHGIRMDVFLNDEEGTIYNVEMQNDNSDSLERRVRYYQSGIDRHTLKKNTFYKALKESYIIFVCSTDYFGFGNALYERESKLKDLDYVYDDGSHAVFLNSAYIHGNASPAVLEFLDFVRDSKNADTSMMTTELGKMVRNVVRMVRNNNEMEAEYMSLETLILEREMKAEEKGIEKGVEYNIRDTILRLKNIYSLEELANIVALPVKKVQEIINGQSISSAN